MRMLFLLLMFAALLAAVSTARGEAVSWLGGPDAAWEEPVNWTPAKVPVRGDAVLMTGGDSIRYGSDTAVASVVIRASRLNLTSGRLTVTAAVAASVPDAAFNAPAVIVAGLPVQFTDASDGVPMFWQWDFGDGTTSTLRHPVHLYATAGSYPVTLVAGNVYGSASITRTVPVSSVDTVSSGIFNGTVILGAPAKDSITVKVFATAESGMVTIRYGRSPDNYSNSTETAELTAGVALEIPISGLLSDTRYYYRLYFERSGGSAVVAGNERTFHTARLPGSPFSFTIQADSHLDDKSDLEVYRRTLANVLSDLPDFHIDLGDTFMCEKYSAPLTAVTQTARDQAVVTDRYRYELANFGLLSHSVPLYLVNGNHEGEAGWLTTSISGNLPLWAALARLEYFHNPPPGSFYGGDTAATVSGLPRRSWYSWNWGDALFIVLDPYWNSTDSGNRDPWGLTLGEEQYRWLQQTLSSSSATFKFVFIHNLVGGLDGQMRGGIEAAPYFEWGGRDPDGADVFADRRPGWGASIHQLLVTYGVTAVFHGHDHLYASQELDGIIYQEVPQPSAVNYSSGAALALQYHYASGTVLSSSGHIRVTVDPKRVTSDYVQSWLPAQETSLRKNRQVADTWNVSAHGMLAAGFRVDGQPAAAGVPVVFTDMTAGSPAAWRWDFGDGSTSSLQSPEHVYAAEGIYTVTLTVINGAETHGISRQVTIAPAVTLPAASFSSIPLSPRAGEAVSFTDLSSGNPTTWAWNFGDGIKSTFQNPDHSYASAGVYTVTLKVTNKAGTASVKQNITVASATVPAAFGGSIILGSPTGTSVMANIFSPDQSGTVYVAYGTASAVYGVQTSPAVLAKGSPLEIPFSGLVAGTRYFYRLYFKGDGSDRYLPTEEFSFHTARTRGSTFSFALQGDSHPERADQFSPELYRLTLQTAAADRPDFYLAIGDDFSVDTLDPATVTQAQVAERYVIQRPYLGLIGNRSPVYLVNGNHEQAARYLLDGTPDNVAVWAQNARNSLYSQPAPDSFYSGNPEIIPHIGLLRNHFSWEWGDALFVVIDPYWGSPVCVDNPFAGGVKTANLWEVTHGEAQYAWLKAVLEQSTARHKFVFAHHVMGTGRGGVEFAGKFEWGGLNNNGSWGFGAYRPGWASTIHQLMVDNHVTIFFQGHDHIWARQELDGVTYQTLPEPADPNYKLYNDTAFLSGDKYPNSGYTRVTVSPVQVKVEYVRTWLPADEGPEKISGSTVFSYTLP